MCWPYDGMTNKCRPCTKMWTPRCAKTTITLGPCSVHSPVLLSIRLPSQDVGRQCCQIHKRGGLNSTKNKVYVNGPSCHTAWKTNRKTVYVTGGKERCTALPFTPPLPTAISTGGNQYEKRAFRNKYEILPWQKRTYWLENFPVVVKALFPIQPNTQVLSAFFNPHYFFNQFKDGVEIKASKDLLPSLLAVFSTVSALERTSPLVIKLAVLLQQAPAKSQNTKGQRAL